MVVCQMGANPPEGTGEGASSADSFEGTESLASRINLYGEK